MASGYTRTVTSIGLVATIIVALLLLVTNPAMVGPLGVTAWFLALLVALSSWFALVAYWLGQHLPFMRSSEHDQGDSRRRGLFLGGFVVIMLGLSSLHQLGVRDALLLGLLLLLVEFYVVARR